MKKTEQREQLDAQELMARIDELLRILEEKHEIVELTYRGKVIADIVPKQTASNEGEQQSEPEQSRKQELKVESTGKPDDSGTTSDAAWNELKRIALELDSYWPKDIDAVEAVRDARG